jgi:hypothetical protein
LDRKLKEEKGRRKYSWRKGTGDGRNPVDRIVESG